MVRNSREAFKVYGNVFDAFTLRVLNQLRDKGVFVDLKSPVFVGKESNVFTATSRNGEVIVKIYRLESCDFNRMYDYIKYDERYKYLRKNHRRIIFAWTKREYRNLFIAREAGVRVPTPISVLHNVLVIESIRDSVLAPMLKDQNPADPKQFLAKVVIFMRKLFRKKLVHGDLSGFNILNSGENPVFIDFSQATTLENPRAYEYLKRDIKNVCVFFKKLGVDCDEDKIFGEVTN